MSMNVNRFDFVGSFLRPEELKQSRLDFEEGRIDAAVLASVEDRLIRELVARQEAEGFRVITDGEYRRAYWHLDFMWGLKGVRRLELDHGYFFHGEETAHGSAEVVGRISGEDHPFVEHFKFVQALTDSETIAKQTIPAPAQTLAEFYRGDNARTTAAVYPDPEKLIRDLAAAYNTVIRDLYAAGCRAVQLDDCTWGMIVDPDYWRSHRGNGFSVEEEADRYLRVNNLALEGLPVDLEISTHVCRGNYHSAYASKGPYDTIAPWLFAKENVDAFYLEFDDERSGGFEPLKSIPEGKRVALGLVTTKSPVLERKDAVIARIREAARFVSLERLSLSPQCGFASCEIGNKLTEEEQWAKLRLVREIAREVWKTE